MIEYAILAFLIALVLGVLRSFWKYLETKKGNPPTIWRNVGFQIGSWIVVALCSLYASFIAVLVLELYLPELVAQFFFGVILCLRWIVSGLIGHLLGEKQIQKSIIQS